ncbi:MAG: NAD-dependent epimerase/dehydratase family protein [bacterium]|nr:NAD-dependent epimerase/dehydratase family protein [bacterium]
MVKKVLVTGVAGFIGSNLAERLITDGYAVVGIDNLSYGIMEQVPKEVQFYNVDIRSKDMYPFFQGVDAVFHLAAKNCLPDCQTDPVETMDINVMGTVNVFEAAKRAGVSKMMYAQSSVLEEGEKRLKGFYAISKVAGQWIDEGYKDAFGLTTVALRYFNVYGPRQDYRRASSPIISKFIIKMLKGEPPLLFVDDDKNKRDFVYIDDINDFHIQCLTDERVNNKLFRLGSGKNTSINELFNTIKKVTGSSIEPLVKERPNDPDFQPVESVADISDAATIDWIPKTSLKTGIAATVEYLKSEKLKGNIQ